MSELNDRIDALASLMSEFGLAEAEQKGDGWRIAFKRHPSTVPEGPTMVPEMRQPDDPAETGTAVAGPDAPSAEAPRGTPISSPMTGIYYSSPSPSAPSFVRIGDIVEAGQVVGLIEAMKVFNEIVAPVSGTVTEVTAQNGQLVQPGEALLYIA